jgi:hypothetical protein
MTPTASFISPVTRRIMRAMSNRARPFTALIQHATVVAGAGGSHADVWVTDVIAACRMTPSGGDESIVAGQPWPIRQWRVAFAAGVPVTESNRLVVTGTDGADNAFMAILDVVTVREPRHNDVDTVCTCVTAKDQTPPDTGDTVYPSVTLYPDPTLFPTAGP